MSPSGVPSALARVPGEPEALFQMPFGRSRGFQKPFGRSIALTRVIITLKTLIQIDGAIGADDLHLAHDIPYALGSVRCVV